MRPAKSLLVLGLSLLLACAANTDEGDAGEAAPETQEGAWEAESVDHEAASTHLWIVNRGIELLARHAATDPIAERTVAIMNDSACRAEWQQGLLDADFKAAYNNGDRDLPLNPSDLQVARSGATWESHFYDPDTGKNYKGDASRTAFTESKAHIGFAFENHLESHTRTACYELGLALHYFTDITQPMHTVNFTALSRPAKLHSNIEGYSMEIQTRYPLADWSGPPSGTVEDFIVQTAKGSKPLFSEGVTAIVNAYKSYSGWHVLTCRNIEAAPWRFIERQHLDYRHCWEGNAEVDAVIGKTLEFAQDHTAKFLYLVGKQLPGDSQ